MFVTLLPDLKVDNVKINNKVNDKVDSFQVCIIMIYSHTQQAININELALDPG